MAEAEEHATPDDRSNPVDSSASSQSDGRPVEKMPLAYARADSGLQSPPISVAARATIGLGGFVTGASMVACSGVILALDALRGGWLAGLYAVAFGALTYAIIASVRQGIQHRGTHWFTLGVLIGGGVTCLIEGCCFAFGSGFN